MHCAPILTRRLAAVGCTTELARRTRPASEWHVFATFSTPATLVALFNQIQYLLLLLLLFVF